MGTPNQPAKPATKPTTSPAGKPATQPVKQTEKPLTNDTTTSKASANTELQPNLVPSSNIGAQPLESPKDNISKEGTLTQEAIPGKTFEAMFNADAEKQSLQDFVKETEEKALKAQSTESPLQNEKSLLETLKELKKDDIKPLVQLPSPGRVVIFHFAKEDSICSNNQVDILPAFVAKADGLKPSLSVFTMDSRDPVVLRKEIPHISVAPKDSEDKPVKPYWEWPVIR